MKCLIVFFFNCELVNQAVKQDQALLCSQSKAVSSEDNQYFCNTMEKIFADSLPWAALLTKRLCARSLLVCRYGLSRLSPLLSGVLAVEEGKVMVTVTPEGLTLPADAYSIRVEPLRYCLLWEKQSNV